MFRQFFIDIRDRDAARRRNQAAAEEDDFPSYGYDTNDPLLRIQFSPEREWNATHSSEYMIDNESIYETPGQRLNRWRSEDNA
jgi:hypothetical protein